MSASVNVASVISLTRAHSDSKNVAHESGVWNRIFTVDGVHPFDQIKWKLADARIVDPNGDAVFEQKDVEVPEWWNQTSINVVSDKYMRVVNGVKENSVKQIFSRVCSVLRRWAEEQNFFNTDKDAQVYEEELIHALIHQYGAFNSPVWFNLGIPDRKQMASACFISGVEDTVEGIMAFQNAESTIFRSGSGSGANLSDLRSSYEKISAGSYTCGPISWMEANDKFAKAFKSGGATRNAAKMVVIDMDHPDILETRDKRPGFIKCKADEEILAHKLVDIGYSADYDDPNGAYKRVRFQNANHSVSVPDSFMQAMLDDGVWNTCERLTGKNVHSYKARELWLEIAKAAWVCGDPGVHFSDTLNKWHTTPKSGRIRSTNPCFAPGTRITTEFGLMRISDLYERVQDGDIKVAVHLGDKIEMRPAIVFPTGFNPIVRVDFKSRRSIEVTPNHNFLLSDGTKKPAEELNAGDVVDIQCGEGSFGNYELGLSDELDWYRIAGFVVGDGWMTSYDVKRQYTRKSDGTTHTYPFESGEIGMCFGKDDKDCLEKVCLFLESREIPYSLKRQKGSVGESPDYLRIRRKPIFKALEGIASPAGCKSYTKRIQYGVFEASKDNQFAFLAGLFSADGTFRMSAKGHGGNIPTREMRLSSVNLDLLRDVQYLLLNLGIKSTIIQNRNTSRDSKFEYITVSGEKRVYSSSRNLHELFICGHSLRKLRDGMKSAGGMLSTRKENQLDEHLPARYMDPIHDIWHDAVVSVTDVGREELTYNMTEPTTHTIIAEGIRIPQCSEFANIDNTACNLCAINLTKFFDGRSFNYNRFAQSVRLFSTAQMAIVEKADYPTEKIARNSIRLRPIGMNYGDLGALLMKFGFGYDSDNGRAVAARLASLMTGIVYQTSARLASRVGAFEEFNNNRDDMIKVMRKHQETDANILKRWNQMSDPLGSDVVSKSTDLWKETISLGEKYGYYIQQSSLMAPLGTVSFLMGMSTTGIEPAFSLVSYKSLVGGGLMKLINPGIREVLLNLGYSDHDTDTICKYVEEKEYIENAPNLKLEHLSIFDCAMPSGPSKRHLSPMAHIKMMAAIQPLITCAQSKTVNLPSTITPEEIADIYTESWRLGLKCVALYRDGSKASQPLATKERMDNQKVVVPVSLPEIKEIQHVATRKHMPYDVTGWRHKFEINGYKGYIIVNEYPDGKPGEVFLKLGKPGSTIAGLIDGFTQQLSIALQHGVPLPKLIQSFVETRFEPAGFTNNKKIRFTSSLYDYLFKYLDLHYYGGKYSDLNTHPTVKEASKEITEGISKEVESGKFPSIIPPPIEEFAPKKNLDAPPCARCGTITSRAGSCYLCPACGQSSGCN